MTATNPWSSNLLGPTVVPTGAIAITPNDDNDLSTIVRALEVGVAGNVAVVFVDGTSATLAFAVGERKTGFIARVKATGTTATGIIGLK